MISYVAVTTSASAGVVGLSERDHERDPELTPLKAIPPPTPFCIFLPRETSAEREWALPAKGEVGVSSDISELCIEDEINDGARSDEVRPFEGARVERDLEREVEDMADESPSDVLCAITCATVWGWSG